MVLESLGTSEVNLKTLGAFWRFGAFEMNLNVFLMVLRSPGVIVVCLGTHEVNLKSFEWSL